jgi:hypothetical protein
MTLSLHVVKNAIPSTTSNTLNSEILLLKQPSNYEQNKLNLLDHSCILWSTNLKRNIVVARSLPRILKNAKSYSPYIEHTNLSCNNRLVTRATTYGNLCLTTRDSSTLFISKGNNCRDKYQRLGIYNPSIMRCETKCMGQGEMPSEKIHEHEEYNYCGEIKKHKKNNPQSKHEHGAQECKKGQGDITHDANHTLDEHEYKHEHCDYHVEEWRAMKNACSKCARRYEARHDHHYEGLEWIGKRNMHLEYTPQQGKHENELGRANLLQIAKKVSSLTTSTPLYITITTRI